MASTNRFIGVGTVAGIHGDLDGKWVSIGEGDRQAVLQQTKQERTACFILRMTDAYTDSQRRIRETSEDAYVLVHPAASKTVLEHWALGDIVSVEGTLATIRESLGSGNIQYHLIVRGNKKVQHIHSPTRSEYVPS